MNGRLSSSVASLLAALALGGCRGFEPVRDATRATLRPMALAERLQAAVADGHPFELELETPVLSGVFDALCTADGDGHALQLFPDVGGKVFELRFSAGGIDAWTPSGGYRAGPPLDDAEPHLALALAMLLAELLAPLDAERLRGERGEGAGREVLMAPALSAGQVTARLTEGGRIDALTVRLGYVEVALASDGTFTGRGFRGALSP